MARIYINNGNSQYASTAAAPATPTVSASASGGILPSASYEVKVQSLDPTGGPSAWSSNSAVTAVTGPTGSLACGWTAVANAASYRVAVGLVGGSEHCVFTTTSNNYTVVAVDHTSNAAINDYGTQQLTYNNFLYGEVSLPATTASQTAGTVEIDYPINLALPPAYRILVGLGTAVAAGWFITAIAGAY